MKTKLLFLLLCFATSILFAQMSTSRNGNLVTFSFDDNFGGDDWDTNGNPVNLYVFVLDTDASNNQFQELSNTFPGSAMTNIGGNIYELTVDLSVYPPGTIISDISYIYTDNMGNQNPNGFGNQFSAVNRAGFSSFTTLTLNKYDLASLNYKVINGYLQSEVSHKIDVSVFDITGKLVSQLNDKLISNSEKLDLSISEKGIFLIRVNSEYGTKIIKTIF